MRRLLLSILLGAAATASEPDLLQMLARIDGLATKEAPVARDGYIPQTRCRTGKTDAELSGRRDLPGIARACKKVNVRYRRYFMNSTPKEKRAAEGAVKLTRYRK